jgi:hypothetical protein
LSDIATLTLTAGLAETEDVTSYPFFYGGVHYELVDTPGFDDSRHKDDVIASKLLAWLRGSAVANKRLSGIIYIHRITDCRLRGSALTNLRMFRKLVGPEWFQNVILATSFWDEANLTEAAQREAELCDHPDYWKRMREKGSQVVRLGFDRKADQRLLSRVAQYDKILLRAQEEMLEGKANFQTSAAQEVNQTIDQWKQQLDQKFETQAQAARTELAGEQRLANDRLRAQQRIHEQELQAQRLACEQEEARKATWDRRQAENLREQQRQERTQKRILRELQEEYRQHEEREQRRKVAQERYYAAYRCKQKNSGVRVVCNRCEQTIHRRREQFYRKSSLLPTTSRSWLTTVLEQIAATVIVTTMISASSVDLFARMMTILRCSFVGV